MTAKLIIVGVHPLDGEVPCHLIEAELVDTTMDFDWGGVTQDDPCQPPANWQVSWDERPLDSGKRRWVFFFHYLDFTKPLITPLGNVVLPNPTQRPPHLASIEYEKPC